MKKLHEREGGREREIFLLLMASPSGHNVMPKPRAGSFLPGLLCVFSSPGAWVSLCCFGRLIGKELGAGLEVEQPRLKSALLQDALSQVVV